MVGHERSSLVLNTSNPSPELERVLKALDSLNRIRILNYLADRVASVNDIASALELATSTTALHIETLEEAGLIRTELEPTSRGLRKVCARTYDTIVLDLPVGEQPREQAIELSMPIGAFAECQATPTCGLLSETGIIGLLDDPASFYEPERHHAQLIWFHQGYVEYRFPNRLPAGAQADSLRLERGDLLGGAAAQPGLALGHHGLDQWHRDRHLAIARRFWRRARAPHTRVVDAPQHPIWPAEGLALPARPRPRSMACASRAQLCAT